MTLLETYVRGNPPTTKELPKIVRVSSETETQRWRKRNHIQSLTGPENWEKRDGGHITPSIYSLFSTNLSLYSIFLHFCLTLASSKSHHQLSPSVPPPLSKTHFFFLPFFLFLSFFLFLWVFFFPFWFCRLETWDLRLVTCDLWVSHSQKTVGRSVLSVFWVLNIKSQSLIIEREQNFKEVNAAIVVLGLSIFIYRHLWTSYSVALRGIFLSSFLNKNSDCPLSPSTLLLYHSFI